MLSARRTLENAVDHDSQPMLEGDGFRLRPWRRTDAGALVRHGNDDAIARNLGDRFPHPYTRADAGVFLSGALQREGEWAFAIECGGEACGGVGLVRLHDIYRGTGELGYWLGRALWGRGLMTRAVARLLCWAFAEQDLDRVHARVFVGNPASARVLEKNRFTREATMRHAIRKRGELLDCWLYAHLRAEWQGDARLGGNEPLSLEGVRGCRSQAAGGCLRSTERPSAMRSGRGGVGERVTRPRSSAWLRESK